MRQVPGTEAALAAADWVLPVPLARDRLRERGFNQALQLAHQLAPHKTQAQWLLRVRSTPVQHTLPRAQRLRNLAGAFAIEPLRQQQMAGGRAVLVDDVMTTGATLQAAAAALRAVGVVHTTALCIARTPVRN